MNELPREERFARALDAIVTGEETRNPDPLVTFALALQAAEGAANADPLDADRRASIWRRIMAEHGQTIPTSGGPGPLAQPALALPANPWAARPALPRRRSGIVPAASGAHAFVTAFAVVALLIAVWASFAGLREGGIPSVTPTAFAHGAAQSTPQGSPVTSPAGDDEFRSYIPIGRCLLNPKPVAQVQELLGEEREWPERDLSAASRPPEEDASAAAEAARAFEACWQKAGATDRFIWMQQSRFAGPYEERWAQQNAEGREASRHLDLQPADLWIETSQEPNATQANHPVAFLPEHAVQFPDGSIGIPASFLVWEGDPTWVDEAPDPLYTQMLLLVEEDGAWLVDALLPTCVGDCQEFIDGGSWHPSPLRDFTALTPTPGVEASPAAGIDLTAFVGPEECTLEPLSAEEYLQLIGDTEGWPEPEYGPASEPPDDDAVAAALGARAYAACTTYGPGGFYGSERLIWATMSQHSPTYPYYERASREERLGHQLTLELADELVPADLWITPTGLPEVEGDAHNYVYLPDQAVQFPDGRIGIPAALLVVGEHEVPETIHTWLVVMTEERAGWVVDDHIPICVGTCDDYLSGGGWVPTEPGVTVKYD